MSVSPTLQRIAVGAIILPAAAFSLPIAAAFLGNTPSTSRLMFPAQAGGMLAVGAALGAAMPHAFTSGGSHGKAALIGAGAALGAAALADAGWYLLLGPNG